MGKTFQKYFYLCVTPNQRFCFPKMCSWQYFCFSVKHDSFLVINVNKSSFPEMETGYKKEICQCIKKDEFKILKRNNPFLSSVHLVSCSSPKLVLTKNTTFFGIFKKRFNTWNEMGHGKLSHLGKTCFMNSLVLSLYQMDIACVSSVFSTPIFVNYNFEM